MVFDSSGNPCKCSGSFGLNFPEGVKARGERRLPVERSMLFYSLDLCRPNRGSQRRSRELRRSDEGGRDSNSGSLQDALFAMLYNIEVGHSFHDLLFHRNREVSCVLKELATIKSLQVELIGIDGTALLAS